MEPDSKETETPRQSSRGAVITDTQLRNRFLYHPPKNDATVELHARVSDDTLQLARTITATTMPSREQALTLTALEEVRMRWNQAIALDGANLKANER